MFVSLYNLGLFLYYAVGLSTIHLDDLENELCEYFNGKTDTPMYSTASPSYTKYSNYVEAFHWKIQFAPRDHTVLKKQQRLYLIKVFLKVFIRMTLS